MKEKSVEKEIKPDSISKEQWIADYKTVFESREISIQGRKEVLNGRGKFAIMGDGKELAQVVLAKYFQKGDFRSGYYRDQTWLMSLGLVEAKNIFSQIYGNTNPEFDPFNGGRQMPNFYSTPLIDENGEWLDITKQYNIASDMAPTAAQMPRAVGLAHASKLFRNNPDLQSFSKLSNNGNEVCFCTIGDASTSEGHFWESMNAASVLQIPLIVFVWDDGYGISVPTKLQTTKGSISAALSGIQKKEHTNGINIYKVVGWDYVKMHNVFKTAVEKVREEQVPALVHVTQITQPLGHSSSGSHERYKSKERLDWEREMDCLKKMKEHIVKNHIATLSELSKLEETIKQNVLKQRDIAWMNYNNPIEQDKNELITTIKNVLTKSQHRSPEALKLVEDIVKAPTGENKEMYSLTRRLNYLLRQQNIDSTELEHHINRIHKKYSEKYNTHLYYEGTKNYKSIQSVPAIFDVRSKKMNGYEILNQYFDVLFHTKPNVVTFGEDVGKIGDVNQAFMGLQEKYGINRIMDTGIRELSIIGQGIGMALRGLRPIAEIQYLDYLVYGIQPLIDDAATLHYRTVGQQCCPIIVRTRGHRLEGIWHSGSPMGMIINSLRGFHICVPRNMTQAVGFYNTLLQLNDPSMVIECLNGYRLKEHVPLNLLDFTIPLGVPEILKEGNDLTIVSYGSTLRLVEEAAKNSASFGMDCEVIDVQTLVPFDVHGIIGKSLQKTNRILFVDEDVPGGASAYMMQAVLENQEGYKYLDAPPKTLTAKAHRPSYGTDGDYFSKPNIEEIVECILSFRE